MSTIQFETMEVISPNGPVKAGDVVEFWGGNAVTQGPRRGTVAQASKRYLWIEEAGQEVIRWERNKMGFLGVVKGPVTVGIVSSRVDKIRALFLNQKPSYSAGEILHLLEIPESLLLEYADQWEMQNLGTKPGEFRLSRRDVLDLVTTFDLSWSQEEIEEALGPDAASVIPESQRLQRREIALPNEVWTAIEASWKQYLAGALAGKHPASFERWLSWQVSEITDGFVPEVSSDGQEADDMRPGGPNVGNATLIEGPYTVNGVQI